MDVAIDYYFNIEDSELEAGLDPIVMAKDGIAIIDLEIPKFDKFRDNVVEEVREHLEKFHEIKDIKITI